MRLLGCVVCFIVQLAAACLVMRRLVRRARTRRPIPTSLVHVQHAYAEVGFCVAPDGAPRARRGQLQCVCDGRRDM